MLIRISSLLLMASLLIEFARCKEATNNKTPADLSRLPDTALAGKEIFENNCVRCHGMDASGLTGPSLRKPKLKHAPDLVSFTKVVEQGIPGTGMPSNWSYSDSECLQIYRYLKWLRTSDQDHTDGDSAAGKLVYAKAGCQKCHTINGIGIGIGPDLSEIGSSRNASYLKQALIDPGAALPESTDPDNGYGFSLYLPVTIITADGKEIDGLRINEDTYTIQIRDLGNNLFSFNKDQEKSIEKKLGQSLMPSFKSTLTETEINNLVAYLHNLGSQ
jgi:putative heme-binding domain-containing protein